MQHFEGALDAPLLSDLSVGGKPKERSRCGQRCVAVNATLIRKYQTDSFRATVTSTRAPASDLWGRTQMFVSLFAIGRKPFLEPSTRQIRTPSKAQLSPTRKPE